MVPISLSTNGCETGMYGTELICLTSITRKLASQRWKRNSGSWSELRCRGSDRPAIIWLNILQTDTPHRSVRSTPKPMIRRVNTSITTMTQWLRRRIDSQRNRSTLHKLSRTWPMNVSQEGPLNPELSGRWCFASTRRTTSLFSSMPKARDLLSDAQSADSGVAQFHLQDCSDEFWGRPFGVGLAALCRRGKERPIFPICQCSVESEQGCGLDERVKLAGCAWDSRIVWSARVRADRAR